jgi:pimeloyl-ACP methyl ester carboxylesterase
VVVDVGGAALACRVAGAVDGPVVILAHGFPDCARSFREQLPPLVAAGFRVVTPTMRGYAPSSIARDGRYDAAALGADLVGLARHFAGDRRAILVGHDWGAIAAYAACALAPQAFARVVTVAVPQLAATARNFATVAQLRRSWYIGLFQLPLIAERMLAAHDFALVDRLWHAWSPAFTPPAEEMRAVKQALRHRVADVLAYYRAIRDVRSPARSLLFARTTVPALYVHGRGDGCVGVEVCDGVEHGYSGPMTPLVRTLDGGHFVHQENAAEFNRLLMSFVQEPIESSW